MTHNTREGVEEIITDYYDKFPECPQDLVGCTLNQDAVDEFNRARERGEKWLRATLHHQLQKAREGERERILNLLIDVLSSADGKTRVALNENIMREMREALNHSELDQDKQ